jgi:general secretion pathway protein F
MPGFEYKGVNGSGKNVKGHIEAENLKMARTRLKREGIFVTDIKDKKTAQAKKAASSMNFNRGVSVQELSMATRQLATLIKAQIPLVDALAALVDQLEHETLKAAFSDIKQGVNEGSSFHKALAKYPKIFPQIYISMCEAGEMTGTLDVILIRLAEFTEKQNVLRNKIRSAMMYPVLMGVFGFAVMVILFVFVIPKITEVFDDMKQTLPWYTTALINFSNFFADYYIYIISIIVFMVVMFLRWKVSAAGRPQWDSIKMRLPIFGKLNRMVAVSRFSKTLSTLLAGGVPMLNAFDIVKSVVDNKVFEKVIAEARDNVSEGESVAGPLKKSGEFPPIVIHMISIGEKTGDLENMLGQVSEAYDFQVDNSISGLTSILEPLMIIVMGVIVGFIVMAILVPIFNLSNMSGA